ITERGVIETPEDLDDWLAGHPRLRDQEHEKGKTVPTLDDLIDHEFVEYCARENDDDVTSEEVLEGTSSIKDSMARVIIEEERADRF
ncbi:MAG: hypothetical protein ACXWPK_14595, partial [Isosphaeraceae bacterium]